MAYIRETKDMYNGVKDPKRIVGGYSEFFSHEGVAHGMLLRLFKNGNGCMFDTPKVMHFRESNMGSATIMESLAI